MSFKVRILTSLSPDLNQPWCLPESLICCTVVAPLRMADLDILLPSRTLCVSKKTLMPSVCRARPPSLSWPLETLHLSHSREGRPSTISVPILSDLLNSFAHVTSRLELLQHLGQSVVGGRLSGRVYNGSRSARLAS